MSNGGMLPISLTLDRYPFAPPVAWVSLSGIGGSVHGPLSPAVDRTPSARMDCVPVRKLPRVTASTPSARTAGAGNDPGSPCPRRDPLTEPLASSVCPAKAARSRTVDAQVDRMQVRPMARSRRPWTDARWTASRSKSCLGSRPVPRPLGPPVLVTTLVRPVPGAIRSSKPSPVAHAPRKLRALVPCMLRPSAGRSGPWPALAGRGPTLDGLRAGSKAASGHGQYPVRSDRRCWQRPWFALSQARSPMIDRRNSRGAWSRGASFPVVSEAGFCALVGSPGSNSESTMTEATDG